MGVTNHLLNGMILQVENTQKLLQNSETRLLKRLTASRSCFYGRRGFNASGVLQLSNCGCLEPNLLQSSTSMKLSLNHQIGAEEIEHLPKMFRFVGWTCNFAYWIYHLRHCSSVSEPSLGHHATWYCQRSCMAWWQNISKIPGWSNFSKPQW